MSTVPESPKEAALRELAELARQPLDGLGLTQEQAPLLARELWRFLAIKRDELAKTAATADGSAAAAGLPVSPGLRVDALWHAMLLQTSVADAVHAAMGVRAVPHSLLDALQLSDAVKTARRRNALDLFRLRGWAPCLEFWGEFGAAGAAAATAAAAATQPATQTDSALGQAVPVAPVGGGEDDETASLAAAGAPSVPQTSDARARWLATRSGVIELFIKTQQGSTIGILVTPTTTIQEILAALAGRLGVRQADLRLLYDGVRLLGRRVSNYDIPDKAVLDLLMGQSGC